MKIPYLNHAPRAHLGMIYRVLRSACTPHACMCMAREVLSAVLGYSHGTGYPLSFSDAVIYRYSAFWSHEHAELGADIPPELTVVVLRCGNSRCGPMAHALSCCSCSCGIVLVIITFNNPQIWCTSKEATVQLALHVTVGALILQRRLRASATWRGEDQRCSHAEAATGPASRPQHLPTARLTPRLSSRALRVPQATAARCLA